MCHVRRFPRKMLKKVMDEFKDKMTEEQSSFQHTWMRMMVATREPLEARLLHAKWLVGSKVNEDRPEKPMLPKGSFKDGYTEDYKERHWMYDGDGKKVEKDLLRRDYQKVSRRRSSRKKKSRNLNRLLLNQRRTRRNRNQRLNQRRRFKEPEPGS